MVQICSEVGVRLQCGGEDQRAYSPKGSDAAQRRSGRGSQLSEWEREGGLAMPRASKSVFAKKIAQFPPCRPVQHLASSQPC